MKLLVTGCTGFVGQYVKEHFPKVFSLINEKGLIDLRDRDSLHQFIAHLRPDKIIHLAAQAFVPESFKDPRTTFDINFIGTLNLLMALEKAQFKGKMLYIGTGDMYGMVPSNMLPIVETYPLSPRSPYSVSKMAAEGLCFQWSQTADFEITMTRPFNHIGARQNERFVVSNFAKQVAEIKLGLSSPILHVGDIDVTRDFTDVGDVVRAFDSLLKDGKNGETYNICSGKEHSLREVIEILLSIASVKASIQQDSTRMRKNEHRRIRGSFEKIQNTTGWKPHISLEKSLLSLLQYWEKVLYEKTSINHRNNRTRRRLSSRTST